MLPSSRVSPALEAASSHRLPRRTRMDWGVRVPREGVESGPSRCWLGASLQEFPSALFFGLFGRLICVLSCDTFLFRSSTCFFSLLCFNPTLASSSLLFLRRVVLFVLSSSLSFSCFCSPHVRSLSLHHLTDCSILM